MDTRIYGLTDHTGEAWDYEVVLLIDDDLDYGRYTLDRGYPYETEEECLDAMERSVDAWREKWSRHLHEFVQGVEQSGARTQA